MGDMHRVLTASEDQILTAANVDADSGDCAAPSIVLGAPAGL